MDEQPSNEHSVGWANLRLTVLIVALAAVVSYGTHLFFSGTLLENQRQRIAALEKQNQMLQATIARQNREQSQMVALAEARSEELWTELESKERQIARLWRELGKPVKRQRRSLAGSRGGTPLSRVRGDYGRLCAKMKRDGQEIQTLRQATREFKAEQQRLAEIARRNAMPSLWPCEGELNSGFGPRFPSGLRRR